MQKELLNKIDTLIEMAKSTSNIDTLKAELENTEEEILRKKRDLEDLKVSMQDDKYVKASDKIIDENIKVSLELKIRKLEGNLKDLNEEKKISLKKESTIHKLLENLKNKKKKLENLIRIFMEKLNSLDKSNSESKTYYENLIQEQEQKKNIIESEIEKTQEEYSVESENLTDLTNRYEFLEKRIASEKEKLSDTITSLQNNISYIDENLKKEDEKKLKNLETKLDVLYARKEEILNDGAFIGNEAKELLIEDDRTGALLKIRELVRLVRTFPYMDIDNSKDVERVLKEAEERAIFERDEYANLIENKKYEGNDTEILNDRLAHLENNKAFLESELSHLKNRLEAIDNSKIRELSSLISGTTIVSENLKRDLKEYGLVMNIEDDSSTPKKKAILTAAFNKKEEELAIILDVIDAYEDEMTQLMAESKDITENRIQNINQSIKEVESSMKEISKKMMISSKTKDILAVENDKAKLKELSETVKEIMARRKFNQTPNEIYDEIEMSLGRIEETEEETIAPVLPIFEEPKPVFEAFQNDFRISDDFKITPDNLNRSEKNKEVLESNNDAIIPNVEINDNPIVNTYTEEETSVPELNPVNLDTFVNVDDFEESLNRKERFRVTNIERLEEPKVEEKPVEQKEEIKTDDILIGNLTDDDYIDFDSIIGKVEL